MSEQIALNLPEARRRRDDGIQRASDHAEQEREGWKQDALAAFRKYAETHATFTTEAVRAANPNLPPPPDKRAFGAVARAAKAAGMVEAAGVVQAQSPSVHCMWVTLWRSKVLFA